MVHVRSLQLILPLHPQPARKLTFPSKILVNILLRAECFGIVSQKGFFLRKVFTVQKLHWHSTIVNTVRNLSLLNLWLALGSCHVKCSFHCNFTAAKLKMDGSRTARPKLFFASFVSFKKKISRMICHIIDPAKAFYMCCEECLPELAHINRSELALIDRFAYSCSLVRKYRGMTDKLEPRKNRFHAEMTLDVFNKKHGTMYKLVKSLKCNIVQISFGVYKFHCNFKAKVEDPAGSCAGASSSKLFFGSIVKSILFSEGEGDCCILDGKIIL